MKRLALWFVAAVLCSLPAYSQGHFSENLTITNSPTAIVIGHNVSSVMIRENSSSPGASFIVTPAAAGSVAVNLGAGQAYRFSAGSQQYPSGTTLGTIQSAGAGPFTFVLLESNSPSAAVPAQGQGSFSENLTVTSSPSSMVVNHKVSSVIVRENSAIPGASFIITPAGAGAVAVNLAAGQIYQFSAGSQQFASGTMLGTIQSTGAGPFTFVLMESNSLN